MNKKYRKIDHKTQKKNRKKYLDVNKKELRKEIETKTKEYLDGGGKIMKYSYVDLSSVHNIYNSELTSIKKNYVSNVDFRRCR